MERDFWPMPRLQIWLYPRQLRIEAMADHLRRKRIGINGQAAQQAVQRIQGRKLRLLPDQRSYRQILQVAADAKRSGWRVNESACCFALPSRLPIDVQANTLGGIKHSRHLCPAKQRQRLGRTALYPLSTGSYP